MTLMTNTVARIWGILTIASVEASAESRRRIVISIPDRKLVVLEGTRVLKMYDVAVGKPSTPSPQGEFRVINRIPDPTWYGPGKIVGPGRKNPLGTRWIGLSVKGYGIHGTNEPQSIGKAASHGCIRMRQRDLEEVFQIVDVGTAVELYGERPVLLAMIYTLAIGD
jgi:lipoprotein-anchoring transpeptidase ErfK/SrfK